MGTLRQLNFETDLPRVAQLLNQVDLEPVTAAQLREWWTRQTEGEVCRRVVLTLADGAIVGYGMTRRRPWEPPGRFWLALKVDPAQRRQGFGSRLYDHLTGFALDHGATRFEVDVRDNLPEALRFAEQRGFWVRRHSFESVLRLDDFDETRFAGVVEAVEATAIRFASLAEMGDSEANRRRVYDLNRRLVYDIPGFDGEFAPVEDFTRSVFQASWYRPEGQIVALDGEDMIGLAAVGYFPETNSMYNMFTGVVPAYRGRHIALALKLLSLRLARQYGVDYIRTNNDADNAPMLAVNHKLGYQPVPGLYYMTRTLA